MSNQLQITGGAKVRSLEGVITGTTGVLGSLPINTANGIPQLDSNGKILVSQLPNSVMEYKGTWNVSTNTPYLVNGVGNAGDVYLVEGAATGGTTHNFGAGNILFFNGDQTIYDGSAWQRASGSTGTVTSVAITESGDALSITGSPITTSGTINIGFAGTSAQYVAGDGTLITFPTTISSAQNLITEVYNETGATLTKGTVVYINGGHGNLPTITKALATSDATSAQTYGVVREDITDHNNGYVTVIGRLENLDTQAYATGTQLYLSSTTAGAWTDVKQYAPAHLVYVGIVTRSHPTQGVVEVKIQNGYELDELHNVSAQTPSNNQGLFYNSSTSLWENKSIATALGFIPINGSGTTNYISKFTGSTTISQSGIYEGVTGYVSIGSTNTTYPLDVNGTINTKILQIDLTGTASNPLILKKGSSGVSYGTDGVSLVASNTNNTLSVYFDVSGTTKQANFYANTLTAARTYTLPDASGTLALTSELSGVIYGAGSTYQVAWFNATNSIGGSSNLYFDPTTNRLGINQSSPSYSLDVTGNARVTGDVLFGNALTLTGSSFLNSMTHIKQVSVMYPSTGYTTIAGSSTGLTLNTSGSYTLDLSFPTTASYTYTFPSATGTLALTSQIPTLSGTAPISYSAGVISISQATNATNGYLSSTDWTTFNNKQNALSGTGLVKSTAGSITYITDNSSAWNSGSTIANLLNGVSPISFNNITGAISISQANTSTNGYLSSTDWNTFNGKQNALTNPVTGTGTANYHAKFTGTSTLGNSGIYEGTSGYVSIGNTNSTYNLDVTGTGRFTGNVVLSGSDSRFNGGDLTGRLILSNSSTSTYIALYGASHASVPNTMAFVTNSANALTLASTGAATFSSSVTAKSFTLNGTNGNSGQIIQQGDLLSTAATNFLIQSSTGNGIGFLTNGGTTFNMFINSSGNVGIGTTSPSNPLTISSTISYGSEIYRNNAADSRINITNTTTTSGGDKGLMLGEIGVDSYFYNYANGSAIFATNATERMRITSGGNVGIGMTGSSDVRFRVQGISTTSSNFTAYLQDSAGTTLFYVRDDGYGYLKASAWVYGSDLRMKENIYDVENGLDIILKMKPKHFDYIDGIKNNIGFIAQDIQKIIPDAVSITNEETGMLGLKTDFLVPYLVKAIQEQQAQIEELKAKING